MSEDERRRYFRIDDLIGISYQMVDRGKKEPNSEHYIGEIIKSTKQDDSGITALIDDLAKESPTAAKLAELLNTKIERILNHFVLESRLVERMAHKFREANISACGIAFFTDEAVPVGTEIDLALTLLPNRDNVHTLGIVVGCDATSNHNEFYWRVDFYGMDKDVQEQLIQHIVKRQGRQLSDKWK